MASANEAPHWMIRKTYLRSTVAHAVPLLVCLHGPSCYHPETGFSPTLSSRLFCSLSPQLCTNHLLKHLQLIGLLTLPLSHSFPRGIELTEYNCQSVFPHCGCKLGRMLLRCWEAVTLQKLLTGTAFSKQPFSNHLAVSRTS